MGQNPRRNTLWDSNPRSPPVLNLPFFRPSTPMRGITSRNTEERECAACQQHPRGRQGSEQNGENMHNGGHSAHRWDSRMHAGVRMHITVSGPVYVGMYLSTSDLPSVHAASVGASVNNLPHMETAVCAEECRTHPAHTFPAARAPRGVAGHC